MIPDPAALYEEHAVRLRGSKAAIGEGDFDWLGRAQLEFLTLEGLAPHSKLLDFGCGIGRLAVHAIPYLSPGNYLGLDIAPTMIRVAQELIRERLPELPPESYRLGVNEGENLSSWGSGFDFICAYSVFTHMEAEDSYRYMREFFRLLRPGGKMVASVLALETKLSRKVFEEEAALTLQERWGRVRNVTTSFEAMNQIAAMAGYCNLRWYRGDRELLCRDDGTRAKFGQSVLAAEKPSVGA